MIIVFWVKGNAASERAMCLDDDLNYWSFYSRHYNDRYIGGVQFHFKTPFMLGTVWTVPSMIDQLFQSGTWQQAQCLFEFQCSAICSAMRFISFILKAFLPSAVEQVLGLGDK